MDAPANASSPDRPTAFPRHDPRRAGARMATAAITGVIVGALLAPFVNDGIAAVAGWDAAGAYLLTTAWWIIGRSSPDETRRRAAAHDPGRRLLSGLVIVASSFSMLATGVLMRFARALPGPERVALVVLCIGAAVIAWLLTHTSYALRYAHLYYSEKGEGGLEFPTGGTPCDLDFAYFAFTIGMCFQVSDVTISSRRIRRTALAHALLSFAFNTIVFALALNLVFSLLPT